MSDFYDLEAALSEQEPFIAPTAYVAPGAVVSGAVTLGDHTSIWHNSVLHGDVAPITVGNRSSIQECCCVHVGFNTPTIIGDDVTIGHGAIIHGCTIERDCTIGMGAIIMDHAVVGEGSFVGAGAIVTEHTIIPPNSVVIGAPARVRRQTTELERQSTQMSVSHYVAEAEKAMRKQTASQE
jgi:carbonic anhydrase/acetyltransferase-like protein (isoleucine patch superfamily)